MRILLLPQAQEDLEAITEPLLSKVLKRIQALSRYPEFGAAMAGPFSGYRSTIVGFFRIVYRQVSPQLIHVAYIRHCRRTFP